MAEGSPRETSEEDTPPSPPGEEGGGSPAPEAEGINEAEPVPQEPINQEPVPQEPVTQEPVTQEPVTQALASEKPLPQEPVPEEPVGACGHLQHSGEPQPWLNTLISDLASITLFSGAGTALGILTPLMGPRDVLGPLVACMGLWGAGVERGKIRPPSAAVCLLLSAWAAAVHVIGELAVFGQAALGLPLAGRAALILVIGAFLPAFATRFDRGEAAWRAAARSGPASGFAPLAAAIAAWRPPTFVSYLLLLLLPLDLAARALSVAAILGYQLTASRLMPSACRYEPTCSRYGFRAYLRHSWIKATLLTAFRVLRCSPIGSGGYDPIPRPAPLRPGPLKTEDFIP